jgi:TolB-like protein
MKILSLWLLLVCGLSVFSAEGIRPKVRLAVLGFNGIDMSIGDLNVFADSLGNDLFKANKVFLVDKESIKRYSKKNKSNAMKDWDLDRAVEVGRGLSVDYAIYGSMIQASNLISVTVTIVNVEKDLSEGTIQIQFKNMSALKEQTRYLAYNVMQKVMGENDDQTLTIEGRKIISTSEYEMLEKKSSIAMGHAVSSAIAQCALFGLTVLIPENNNPAHVFTSLAMAVPPWTMLYTEDWEHAPMTVGFAVGGGLFNFVGFALIENSQGLVIRNVFGAILLVAGACGKLYAMISDVLLAISGVEKYNTKLRDKYIVDKGFAKKEAVQIMPYISMNGIGVDIRY